MLSKNSLFGPFSGILEVDSPSAKSAVLTILDSAAFEKLSESYKLAADQGALLEENIERNPQIRFNPRPARLIHLLLTEAECRDLEIIEKTVVASGNRTANSMASLCILEHLSFQDSPYLSILLLDELRHLHMQRDRNNPEIKEHLLALAELSKNGAFEYWPRISKLISTSLQRAQRGFKANSPVAG